MPKANAEEEMSRRAKRKTGPRPYKERKEDVCKKESSSKRRTVPEVGGGGESTGDTGGGRTAFLGGGE